MPSASDDEKKSASTIPAIAIRPLLDWGSTRGAMSAASAAIAAAVIPAVSRGPSK